MTDVSDFGPFTLSPGAHENPQEGMCVMEMVSFLAGERWSDMPPCSSPAIARFCQVGNDNMPQEWRDKLQSYVPRLIGTISPQHEQRRAEIAAWAAIRVFAPIALDGVGLHASAERLRCVEDDFSAAESAAWSAESAAESAAGSAKSAAESAAWSAARSAAWSAESAAWSARRAAGSAESAAWSAESAAESAAKSAAWSAADKVWREWFKVLDAMIEAGPHGEDYLAEHSARATELRKVISSESPAGSSVFAG